MKGQRWIKEYLSMQTIQCWKLSLDTWNPYTKAKMYIHTIYIEKPKAYTQNNTKTHAELYTCVCAYIYRKTGRPKEAGKSEGERVWKEEILRVAMAFIISRAASFSSSSYLYIWSWLE